MLSIWITIVAGLGVLSVEFGYYQAIYGEKLNFPLEAYFFSFVAFLITMWPFTLLNMKKVEYVGLSPALESMVYKTMKICLFLFSINLVIYFNAAIYSLQFEPSEVYASQHFDGEMLYKFGPIERFCTFYISLIYNVLAPLFLIYSLIILTRKGTNKKKLCYFFMLLMCLTALFQSIMTGARGGIFVFVLLILIVSIPFWKNFDSKVKSTIKTFGYVFAIFVIFYVMAMTVSRFEGGAKETPFEGLMRYFGEPFPNVGHMLWDKVEMNPFGLRLYPYFFQANNIASSASSISEEFYDWESIIGVPLYIFKTEFGDFYIEFGKYLSLFIMFLYSLFFRIFIRKGRIEIAAIPIFYYFLDIAASSPMDFAKRYYFHIIVLVLCVISYFVIRLLSNNRYVIKV